MMEMLDFRVSFRPYTFVKGVVLNSWVHACRVRFRPYTFVKGVVPLGHQITPEDGYFLVIILTHPLQSVQD